MLTSASLQKSFKILICSQLSACNQGRCSRFNLYSVSLFSKNVINSVFSKKVGYEFSIPSNILSHCDMVTKGSNLLNKPFFIQPSIRIPSERKFTYEWKIPDIFFFLFNKNRGEQLWHLFLKPFYAKYVFWLIWLAKQKICLLPVFAYFIWFKKYALLRNSHNLLYTYCIIDSDVKP